MGQRSTTVESILEAARTAIAERGPGTLTMSAVASAAGISRPTLYRWFPTKDDLFAAITAYEIEHFDVGLQQVIDAHRAPKRRLEAALRYLMNYLDESMMPDPIGVDPEFALKSIADALEPHIEILASLLGDALLEVPAVRAGVLTPRAGVRAVPPHGLFALPGPPRRLGVASGNAARLRRDISSGCPADGWVNRHDTAGSLHLPFYICELHCKVAGLPPGNESPEIRGTTSSGCIRDNQSPGR